MFGSTVFGFLPTLGIKELIVILVIVLVIFGPKKLPEIGKSVGQMLSGFREGKKESDEVKPEAKTANSEDDKPGQS